MRRYLFVFAAIFCSVVVCSAAESLDTARVAEVSHSFAKPKEDKISAMSLAELWDGANTAYANGNYIRAERMYSQILSRGVHSAELYYNLGNVHNKRNEIGLSLLYYYKALRLSPSDSDIRHNIEVVGAKTTDNIEQLPRLFLVEWSEWIGSRFSCGGWTLVSLLAFALALASLVFYLLSEKLKFRRVGFWFLLLFGVVFVVATRHALAARSEILNPSEAVVMSRALSVTSSPSGASTELFILHEGTKVRVLKSLDSWSEIMIADGKRGWVESGRIEEI